STAPANPWREWGNTEMRIISQRVAPSAKAASFWLAGVVANTSRVIAVMIGVIISANIRPVVKKDRPDPPPPEFDDRRVPRPGIGWATRAIRSYQCCNVGARTKTPHRPKTTEGIAARRATTNGAGRRSNRGAP